jgi:hypothetical protein
MIKITKLLELAESFYTKALLSLAAPPQAFTMPDEPDDAPKPAGDLISQAENYDIKDEELYEQFELFMNTYKELLENISFNPKNLTKDSIETAIQANDALGRRYERIITNPYLDVNDKEGWGEDFDPGEFTGFIQKVVRDAEEKLKKAVGKDVDISEVTAAQWANQLNEAGALAAEQGKGKQEAWSAKIIQYMMEYRKDRFKRMMDAKRVGKGHPDFAKYESYIASRHRSYENIKKDPTCAREYQDKMNERNEKWRYKVAVRKQELIELINRTQDPKRLAEYQAELTKLQQEEDRRAQKAVDKATKVREKKQAGTLESYIIHLQQKLASLKSETAKLVKKKAKNDPYFDPFKQAVQAAKNRLNNEASPANQTLLEEAEKKEADALVAYLNNNEAVIKVKTDIVPLYDFRDAVKKINSAEAISPDTAQLINITLQEGRRLYAEHFRSRTPTDAYSSIANTVQEINKRLQSMLQGTP